MAGPDARQACVSNSVDWYRSVSRAHGLGGAIENGVWTCRAAMPPYSSNAVTVSRSGMDAQLDVLRDLVGAVAPPFTVKDSHAHLDLAPLGFHVLFDAQWIRLAEGAVTEVAGGWGRVTTPRELERWEEAWRAHGSPAATRVFVPALLDDESVAVLAAERAGEIVAGAVANRSTAVVGLSNVFAAEGEADRRFAEAVAAVRRFAPGVPVVGYERGDALGRALREGFQAVGSLRIWLREH